MWKVVNKERGKHNSLSIDITDVVLDSNGLKFPTKKHLLEAMNMRFLGAAAACGAPSADVARALTMLRAARPEASSSLRLQPFSAEEVFHLITTRIPPKASKDAYGISMKLLKVASYPLSHVLAELFNRCMNEGTYPTALKISKVVPIFKGKGKRSDIDGYRPVSIIPAIAKVFENGLSSRLVSFLTSTNALSDKQHAYRAGHSTTSLTRELIRKIVAARDGRPKLQVAILCCDLSKAFDVADHAILSVKLRHYGVRATSHSLFTSLLQNRTQVVVGDSGNQRSDPMGSAIGVAQGSSVSNLLFSLLLNDLPDAVTTAEVLMYADDVVAVVTAPSVVSLEQKLNATAVKLSEWFSSNGLALNLRKTQYLHINLSGHKTGPLTVLVGTTTLHQGYTTTFLGFEVDVGLTWENHVDRLRGKIGSACFALRRVARVVSVDVARACYFATVHSLIQYGAELWGRCADWEKIFRLLKRAVRAIVGVDQDTHTKPYFKSLGILTLPSLVILQVAMYVRQNLSSYETRGNHHRYPTRTANKLSNIARTLTKSDKLTHVMGPDVYNRLPEHVTAAPTLPSFKGRLHRWLVEQAFYNIDEFYKFVF